MRVRSLNTPNCFLHLPLSLSNSQKSDHDTQPSLLYFLTGNPGLISYYTRFLTLLSANSTTSTGPDHCIVAGASLTGFDIPCPSSSPEDYDLAELLCYPEGCIRKQTTYSLEEQNNLCLRRIECLTARLANDFPDVFKAPIDVVLIGHSLGTYMALEIIRMHSDRQRREKQAAAAEYHEQSTPRFKVVATILLTPTIMHLARSDSGKLATPLLSNVPGFPTILQLGASGLSASMPTSWLKVLVARLTGMKDGAGLDATVAFLQTPGCVKQSLALAKDELREITEDKWGDEVWGAMNKETYSTGATSSRPRHYFWFARQDHWVAEKTREEIVKTHATSQTIKVDEEEGDNGLVHAWCLSQSEMVADQVKLWIKEILEVNAR